MTDDRRPRDGQNPPPLTPEGDRPANDSTLDRSPSEDGPGESLATGDVSVEDADTMNLTRESNLGRQEISLPASWLGDSADRPRAAGASGRGDSGQGDRGQGDSGWRDNDSWDDDERTHDSTTADISSKLDQTVFSDYPTGELSALAQDRRDLEFEAHLILFAHPEDRMLGTRFHLAPHSELVVGRSSTVRISMPGVRSLSRRHARLVHLGPVVRIDDLGSTNGTYVNDQRILAARRLRSGDRFQVGALHFKFLHEKDPESAYHEAIYQLVVCDGLTRLHNKRKFDEEIRREFHRAQRHERPLTMIFFDLDRFKAVNDNHGHLCGDFVLQQVARLVQPYVRPEQTLARLGGEEFGVLCPEMSHEGAMILAEKLRTTVEAERFRYADVELDVTCSFGVAQLVEDMTRPEELYERADQAMYRSKKEGRNRVSLWAP